MSEVDEVIKELRRAGQHVSVEDFEHMIAVLNCHDRIFVYGTGRTGLILKTFAMRLMQIGKSSFVVGETTCPPVGQGDLLVLASASGQTPSVIVTAQSALGQGADLLVISGTADSDLARVQTPDLVIVSPSKYAESAESIQPLGSLFEQMLLVVLDSTILKLVEEGIASNEAMSQRHANLE